jgi:hypothetical protein
MKIIGYVLTGVLLASISAGTLASPINAQTTPPFEDDRDGDGDPINEELDIRVACYVDYVMGPSAGFSFEPKLNEDDCNFAMHYLSGQCEAQTTIGAELMEVCSGSLRQYLSSQDLLTKDFPTDRERFNELFDELKENEVLEEQEQAQEEADTPSWAKDLDD